MSLVLVAALSVSGPVLPQCSWDRPGANPFMGNVVTAVDRYLDIPANVRATLKKRIAARKYDEVATITRDGVAGAYRYEDLRDMHFGSGTICRTVTRTRWTDQAQERGLVYCEEGHCIIVPTACRNVSRITRAPAVKGASADAPAGPPAPLPGESPQLAAAPPGDGEMQFESPAAGNGRSFASGAGDSPVLPPAGAVGGLEGGTVDPAYSRSGTAPFTNSAGLPFGGFPQASSGATAVPPVLVAAGDPLGNPGIPGVAGVGPLVSAPIPEPSGYLLGAVGIGLLAWLSRRRARAARAAG